MAARFAAFGSRLWARQGLRAPLGALAAGAAGLGGLGRSPIRADSKDQPSDDASNLKPHHLATWQETSKGLVPERKVNRVKSPLVIELPDMNFLNPDELVFGHIILNDSKAASRDTALKKGCVRANACRDIWWEPSEVRAAIVTCGGLCPGLNSIIREVTNCLWDQYGVRSIIGIQGGYCGLSNPEAYPPVELNPTVVREIHMKGGSVLKAGRGGFDAAKICDNLQEMGINMLFTVGGDGTQGAAFLLFEEAKKRNMHLSIVGVPKSIDNDILVFEKTFGFDTAVAQAAEIITNAWNEAMSCKKGVGIVKLMGRDSGFVAMSAALASTLVDLVLIPEVPVKEQDVLAHVDATIARKGYMVIAVAEGAGQEHVSTGKKDATGHTIYGDIGTFLRDGINKHLAPLGGECFYFDPSYIIRSCTIQPNDHIYCARLSRDAVHTAMRGYTGVCVGPIHNILVIIPANLIARGKRSVKIRSSGWQSCVQVCNMPGSLSGLAE